MLDIDYSTETVQNLAGILESQKRKMDRLRKRVKELEFVPLEHAGGYSPITFKAFDGGAFKLQFDPFEFDIVEIADSNGNRKLRFAAPRGDFEDGEELARIVGGMDAHPIIRRFLDMLGKDSLSDISEILTNSGTLMEIAEFACMFDKAMSSDDKTLILKDGLLRTKKIKAELVRVMVGKIEERKERVKMVGVSKTSRIASMLSAAMLCERTFPREGMGYVEIPLDLENQAYRWSGSGLLDRSKAKPLDYAMGTLYIAKLSRFSNLLVTVEVPKNLRDGAQIYSKAEVAEMLGYVARDSQYSYPVMGYPQTIMKAHEFAAMIGLPASVMRDKIMADMVKGEDPALGEYVRDGTMIREAVDKGRLGGRA